jgi:hypothetical protein
MVGLLAGLCLSLGVSAHRMPLGMTTVTYNPNTDSVEIVHRLHRHDAEQAMQQVIAEPGVDLMEVSVQARLALYVEAHFKIARVADGKPGKALALELVGGELDGDYVLVYQELPGQLPLEIAVRDDILRDLFPEQVNRVNVTTDAGTKSLVFKQDDSWHQLVLE